MIWKNLEVIAPVMIFQVLLGCAKQYGVLQRYKLVILNVMVTIYYYSVSHLHKTNTYITSGNQ